MRVLPAPLRFTRTLVGILVLAVPASAWAQGLPAFAPLNPVSSSRSGLYYQPLRAPAPNRWITTMALDYANVIEYNQRAEADFVLDSELLRVSLGLSRDLGRRTFFTLEASAGGAYAGFMDGLLDWYHGALGIEMSEREIRPRDRFLFRMTLPDGRTVQRSQSGLFLGDVRVGLGFRPDSAVQTVLSVTLPTSTGPAGYGRGEPSVSLLNTVGASLSSRAQYEGSLGLGFTPANGSMAAFQRELFVAATSGVRVMVWGRNSVFANLFYHSPYYQGTTLRSLDRRELSFDFGWIIQSRSGEEWRLGLTEDLEPGGPGIDLVLRFGRTF